MKSIYIGNPEIECVSSDVFGTAMRMSAPVRWCNPNTGVEETKDCYFDVEKNSGRYLTPERSDAFVMGLLTTAMENGYDIEFAAPMSARLFFQIQDFYIPMIVKYNQKFGMHSIQLIGPVDDQMINSEGAVATGCSAGVDSLYTVVKYGIECEDKKHRLTHLVCASSGTLDNDHERIMTTYKNVYGRVKRIAKETGLTAVGCYNNLHEFYKFPYKGFSNIYTTTYGAVAYALQQLISVYYQSSGDPIELFTLDLGLAKGSDGSVFDTFTLPCMNTENITFYQTGLNLTRMEKEKYIADFPVAQKYLSVCGIEYCGGNSSERPCNCSRCRKCLRTMAYLYATGKLDDFEKVFDVGTFKSNVNKWIGKWLAVDKGIYAKGYIEKAKYYGIKVSRKIYFYMIFYKFFELLRKKISKLTVARRIYYKLNIDYKLYGYRDAKYNLYK